MSQVGDTVMVLMSYPDSRTIAWDGREYKLVKDKETFIPFELAANYFGDPRAMGAMISTKDHKQRVGWVPDRPTEVRRLRVLYGVQHGDEDSVYLPSGLLDMIPDEGEWPRTKHHWRRIDANIPRVQMYDLETRERLYTVLEDPLGEHVTPAQTTISREQGYERRISQLEDMVRSLTQGKGMVTADGMIAPNPDAAPRQPSPAEEALRVSRGEPPSPEGFDDPGSGEPDGLETIESRRSGAVGLPADTG